MKAILLFAAALSFFASGSARAAESRPSQTDVIFDHPEKFRDVKDAFQPTEKGEKAILDQIRDFLTYEAKYFLPEGDHLTMTFTDIDLVGDFEPWRGPQWEDVRVVKPIYPPEFKFTWQVTDPQGQVAKQGTEDIRDLNFDWRMDVNSDDPLHFEKDILTEWMRHALGGLKKGENPR